MRGATGRLAAMAATAAAVIVVAAAGARAQDDEALRRELDLLERRREEILRTLRARGEAPADRAATPPAGDGGGGVPAPQDDGLLDAVEVVTTRFPRPRGGGTSAVTVVEGAWYGDRGESSVADGLRHVPGVTVTRGGTAGASTSLFLRGALSNQTLVLQDGMPLNDPTIGGQFNFFDLDPVNLDRVEVLRGSQGALYGSDAIGGVVNLVSRRGHGPGSFRATAEAGPFRTHRETLSGAGGVEGGDWSFGLAETRTDGPHSRQAFLSHSFSGRAGFAVAGDGRLEFLSRFLSSRAEDPYDFGATLVEDPNIERRRDLLATGVSFEKPLAPWLTGRVNASVTDVQSDFRNGPDTPGGAREFDSQSSAQTRLVGLSLRAEPLDAKRDPVGLSVVAGFDHEREDSATASESPFGGGIDVDDRTEVRGFYALASLRAGPVEVTAGGRHDDHSQAGGEWSPQAGARFDLAATGTTFRAHYGEGFRSATPAETADPFIGNADLRPEESESVDAGILQRLGPVEMEATWFRLRTRDLITFDTTTFRLENVARAEATGVELAAAADLGGGFSSRVAWTHQRARDLGTGARLANRPDDAASAGVAWRSGDWLVFAEAVRPGSVPSSAVSGPDQRLRDHPGRRTVVDFGVRWKATERLSLLARIENLLGDRYVETSTSPRGTGRTLFIGAALDF